MGSSRWAESKCRRPDTAIKREKCGYFLLAAFACAYAVPLAAGFYDWPWLIPRNIRFAPKADIRGFAPPQQRQSPKCHSMCQQFNAAFVAKARRSFNQAFRAIKTSRILALREQHERDSFCTSGPFRTSAPPNALGLWDDHGNQYRCWMHGSMGMSALRHKRTFIPRENRVRES